MTKTLALILALGVTMPAAAASQDAIGASPCYDAVMERTIAKIELEHPYFRGHPEYSRMLILSQMMPLLELQIADCERHAGERRD